MQKTTPPPSGSKAILFRQKIDQAFINAGMKKPVTDRSKAGQTTITFVPKHGNQPDESEKNEPPIPDLYAMERGGWKTRSTLNRVYQHTFSDDRLAADAQVNEFFNSIVHKDE